ncbi:hypothetical protein [Acinetobacter lactucae]|uniref:hypothetical protein n=1 Tax=Acinetobacter lactucae TaxID=1785128 RepID=UPI0015F7570B|nr:hypothetical protein [Acinetobacter lactucae]
MDNQQVPMFKEWFIDTYPEIKDYLDLTYFDVEKNTFIAKCSYNPDSGNTAKVLRIAFGSWQHQQAKVEELQKQFDQYDKLLLQRNKDVQELYDINVKHGAEKAELQKRVDAISEVLDELQEQADVIRKRGQKFRDSNFLASADMMDICIKEIEQALKGE